MFDFNPRKPTPAELERMHQVIDRAEALTRDDMEAAAKLPDGSDEQRDRIILLIMSLGFGIAAVARTFFDQTDPISFGDHCGKYIGETIVKLKEAEDEQSGSATSARTKKPSAWD